MPAVPFAPAVKILRAVWLAAAAVPETCRSTSSPEVKVDEAAYNPVPVVRAEGVKTKAEEVVVPEITEEVNV